MSKYRHSLPQTEGDFFLTDGGIETTLIFHEGLELPCFAAFDLLRTDQGRATLRRYYETYAQLARDHHAGFILESATWRASPDWAAKLDYSRKELARANAEAIRLLEPIRDAHEADGRPCVISGCVGPRGDGYVPGKNMTPEAAAGYHGEQIGVFADSAADMVCAITMNYVEEALGVAIAAKSASMPVAISFTVETDGRLPTGQPLHEAVEQMDEETSAYPAYFMINCAHPTHFSAVLKSDGSWLHRIRGIRANASRMSHAELDEAPELDAGNPVELGQQYADLRTALPKLNVMGGCCGTDHRHVAEIARACAPLFASAA